MKKENFSFVKWLTNRDIEKILEPLNIEIMEKEDENGNLKKRITRFKDENGNRSIVVFCKNNNYDETKQAKDAIMKEMMQIPALKKMMSNVIMISAMLGSLNPESNFSQYNDMLILKFEDYFLTESLSLKTEDEQIDFDRKLTNNYQNYMSKKFGRFYNSMKSAHYKKLHKQFRDEQQQENKDNNEEM